MLEWEDRGQRSEIRGQEERRLRKDDAGSEKTEVRLEKGCKKAWTNT
jgi:hypothetical protein